MQTWLITGINHNPSGLVRKMLNRGFQHAEQYKKTNVIAICESRPWGILNGHAGMNFQVIPCKSVEDAKLYVKEH